MTDLTELTELRASFGKPNINSIVGQIQYLYSAYVGSENQFPQRGFTGAQGLPAQIICAGWFCVTTLPAMITASLPMVTPGDTNVCAPIHAPSSIAIGR